LKTNQQQYSTAVDDIVMLYKITTSVDYQSEAEVLLKGTVTGGTSQS